MDLLGVGPQEGQKSNQRAATPSLMGKAEGIQALQPGEEKAPGRPHCSLSVPTWGLKKEGERLFNRTCSDGIRGNVSKLKEGKKFLQLDDEILEEIAQRGCRCPIPGTIQGQFKQKSTGFLPKSFCLLKIHMVQ